MKEKNEGIPAPNLAPEEPMGTSIEQKVTLPEALDISLERIDLIERNLVMMSDDINMQLSELSDLRDIIAQVKDIIEKEAPTA